jgi:hypothetical protein
MNTRDLLHPVAEARGGVLLDWPNGELVVLERFAKNVLSFPQSVELAQQEAVLSQVDQLYSGGEAQSVSKPGFTVHATVEDICADEAVRNGLSRLLGVLADAGSCDLAAHFSRPPSDWVPFLRWIHKTIIRSGSLCNHMILRGPFNLMDETAKEGLFGLGVRPEFVVGWWDGCVLEEAGCIRGEVLRDLARFGLRIPLVCYIHAGNVALARALVDDGLRMNEHSGFSLPLVFCHPHYRFASNQPPPPGSDEYRRLLADT